MPGLIDSKAGNEQASMGKKQIKGVTMGHLPLAPVTLNSGKPKAMKATKVGKAKSQEQNLHTNSMTMQVRNDHPLGNSRSPR